MSYVRLQTDFPRLHHIMVMCVKIKAITGYYLFDNQSTVCFWHCSQVQNQSRQKQCNSIFLLSFYLLLVCSFYNILHIGIIIILNNLGLCYIFLYLYHGYHSTISHYYSADLCDIFASLLNYKWNFAGIMRVIAVGQ